MPDPLHPYGAKASAIVPTRLTHAQREQVLLAASAHGCTVGEFTRRAVTRLAAVQLGKPYDDPQGVADDLRAALGLDPEAKPEEIAVAVSELVDELLALDDQQPADAAPADPLQGAPDLNPGQVAALTRVGYPVSKEGWIALTTTAATPAAASTLTAEQRNALKKRNLPQTEAAWVALRKSMVRTPGKEPAHGAAPGVVQLSKAEIDKQVAALPIQLRKQIRDRGLTLEEFVERRAVAVRLV